MVKKTYTIPNMECPNCAMRLEGIEDDLPGIRAVHASYHRRTLEIEYDEKQLTEQDILSAIQALDYIAIPANSP
jgi:copper chaperone CopZ